MGLCAGLAGRSNSPTMIVSFSKAGTPDLPDMMMTGYVWVFGVVVRRNEDMGRKVEEVSAADGLGQRRWISSASRAAAAASTDRANNFLGAKPPGEVHRLLVNNEIHIEGRYGRIVGSKHIWGMSKCQTQSVQT